MWINYRRIVDVCQPSGRRESAEDGEVFSVELVPDDAVDRVVREDWTHLIDAGLPSSGRNPAPSNRPHVTLAVREHIDPRELEGIADLLPLPLELGGVLLFGRSPRLVLTRQVVPGAALLAFHAEVARRVGQPEPHYANTAPDRWSPHMTLARGLDPERLALALRAVQLGHARGHAVGLRVWDASARQVTTLR
jgi:2'-5' RNA ligase